MRGVRDTTVAWKEKEGWLVTREGHKNMIFGARDESHVTMNGRLFALNVRDLMRGRANVGGRVVV